MPTYENCPNCFMPLGGNIVCPNCHKDYTKNKQYTGVLPPFTILNNRYLIGRVLGKGGFGITYIAKDNITNKICAIKEYMPSEYSTRGSGTQNIMPFSDEKAKFVFNHGRDKFMEEAKTLLKLRNNPIVVDILDYFTQNNTAYLVMEYLDGQDLRNLARSGGGKLEPEFAKMVFVTIASSLMEIHRMNILHRDLSPENIIVTVDGRIKLIDFGAARNFVSTQNKGMSILLKPGFAPPEQYNAKGSQGPWSDVYALCATFYTLVSGKPLVDALFRYRGEQQPSLFSLGCPVTKKTSDVIEHGMELDFKKRYKDFKELLDEIDIVSSVAAKPTPPPVQIQQTSPPPIPPTVPMPKTPSQAGMRPQHMGEVPAWQLQSAQKVQPHVNMQNNVPAYQNRYPNGTPNSQSDRVPAKTPNFASAPMPTPAPIGKQPYVAAVVGNTICNKVQIKVNEVFKIGRSQQNCHFIVAGDTNISRIHCYLRFDGSKFYLSDASSNGTFFENGTQLIKNREYIITPGTKFYLATRNHMLILNV